MMECIIGCITEYLSKKYDNLILVIVCFLV